MKITQFFFIQPRRELVELLQSSSYADLQDLTEEFFWTGDYYDRGKLSTEDLCELVKILFTNQIRTLRRGAPGYGEIFHDLTPTKEYFDKHWILRRVELETTVEEELENVHSINKMETIVDTPNPRIRQLLSQYRSPTFLKTK